MTKVAEVLQRLGMSLIEARVAPARAGLESMSVGVMFRFHVVKLAARKTVGKMIRAGDDRLRACGRQRRGGEPR